VRIVGIDRKKVRGGLRVPTLRRKKTTNQGIILGEAGELKKIGDTGGKPNFREFLMMKVEL